MTTLLSKTTWNRLRSSRVPPERAVYRGMNGPSIRRLRRLLGVSMKVGLSTFFSGEQEQDLLLRHLDCPCSAGRRPGQGWPQAMSGTLWSELALEAAERCGMLVLMSFAPVLIPVYPFISFLLLVPGAFLFPPRIYSRSFASRYRQGRGASGKRRAFSATPREEVAASLWGVLESPASLFLLFVVPARYAWRASSPGFLIR